MCPVMTDRQAKQTLFTEYGKEKVFFCCEICQVEFEASPEAYLGNLSPGQKIAVQRTLPEGPEFIKKKDAQIKDNPLKTKWENLKSLHLWSPYDLFDWLPIWPYLFLFVIAVPILFAFSFAKLPSGEQFRFPLKSSLAIALLLTTSLQLLLVAEAYRRQLHLVADTAGNSGSVLVGGIGLTQQKQMHNEMIYHFGNPPRVPFPAVDQPAIARIYYRGNDESGSELFNDGNYLTCTFSVELQDEQGKRIAYHDSVPDRIFAYVKIDRAPMTPQVLYSDKIMKQMFATSQYELEDVIVADDRVTLSTTIPDQQWELKYPLQISKKNDASMEQMIYLWHVNLLGEKERNLVPLLHYAIRCRIQQEDGKVGTESDIQMGPLRLTPPVISFQKPIKDWLSITPLPEITRENPNDPKLLGISDYLP